MKGILAVILALALVLGMSTIAFAASGPIDKVAPGASWTGATITYPAKSNGGSEMVPGDEMSITLDRGMFTPVTSANWAGANDSVLKSDITKSNVSIRSKVKKGAVCIDEVFIDYDGISNIGSVAKNARVVVTLVDPFPSINDIDFEVEVYFVIDGKAFPKDSVVFSGNLSNDEYEIDSETYYAFMADGSIAVVESYVREVEYELMEDGGVTLIGPAIKSQKYWGVANNEPTPAQADTMDEYDINEVINLRTIGLDRIAKHVNLSIANPSDYVYDANLNYLGRADEELPFSSTYYLASSLLDIAEEEEEYDEEEVPEEDEEYDDYELPSESGGDGYIENVNDNPGTGR